ncbi:unnamed protein product [Ectocarpus sp. 4 AP-2014]
MLWRTHDDVGPPPTLPTKYRHQIYLRATHGILCRVILPALQSTMWLANLFRPTRPRNGTSSSHTTYEHSGPMCVVVARFGMSYVGACVCVQDIWLLPPLCVCCMERLRVHEFQQFV